MRSFIARALRRLAHVRPIRNLLATEQDRPQHELIQLDVFTDSNGAGFQRLEGYRDLVVPRWPNMFAPRDDRTQVGPEAVAAARRAVSSAEQFLNLHGSSFVDADVLEIGCHGGAHAFAMIEQGASAVHGIDVPSYGVRQRPDGEADETSLREQSEWLVRLRTATARAFGLDATELSTTFSDLDVIELEAVDSYDVIVSWQTLEHLVEPAAALSNMYRALRPGGGCFHAYNPFFAVDGGHSLCTLDFPYGHARLSTDDFVRYLRTYRPNEVEVATRFYTESLNRMTFNDLRRHVHDVGFEILALLNWPSHDELDHVEPRVLAECRGLYPTVTIGDLISRSAWVLLRKPPSALTSSHERLQNITAP